jgi:hypothetical protein
MQPYNYSIDLPAPPADNFLQNIMGIAQLQQMGQQQKIASQQAAFQKEMQPLEMDKVREQIKAAQASAAQSGASTNLLGVQTDVAKLGLADKRLISSTLQSYANDKTKTVEDLIPILPLLDTTAVENIGKAEQIRVNREVDTALKEGKKITANDIRGWSNRQTLLKGPEQQQFQQSFLAMTPQFKEAAKSGMISAVNAAFAGNMEVARNSAAEVQQALLNSNDTSPAAKAVSDSFGTIVDLIDQNPNIPKEILALNVVNAAGLVGDPRLAEDALKVVKEFGDQTATGKTTKEKQIDEQKAELEREKLRLGNQKLQQEIDTARDADVKKFASENKEGYKLNEQARFQLSQAQKAKDILQTVDSLQSQLPKNIGQSFVQYLRDKVPAYSNDISFLRTQYEALVAPEAKKNLPPGSASDADMREARKGITSRNATPEQFRKAVELIARETENQAKYTEARLAWMSKNRGSVGSAVRDLNIFGSNVPKGASLNAWWSKVGKNLDPYAMPSETSPAAAGGNPTDVDSILKRFGVPQ